MKLPRDKWSPKIFIVIFFFFVVIAYVLSDKSHDWKFGPVPINLDVNGVQK